MIKPRLVFMTVILCVLAAPLYAGGLQKNHVASDARWIAHVDIEAFVRSRIGEHITNHPDRFDFMSDMDEASAELGFDVLRELRSATIYGTGNDDGAVVITGTAALDNVLNRMDDEPTYRRLTIDGYEIHFVGSPEGDIDGDDEDDGQVEIEVDEHVEIHEGGEARHELHVGVESEDGVYLILRPGVTPSDRIAVVAGSAELAARGMQVIEKKRPNLADEPGALTVISPRAGSFVFIAIDGVSELANGVDLDSQVGEVASRARELVFDLGENQAEFFAIAAVTTGNDEDAVHVAQVVQGLVALAQLMAGNDPDIAEFKKVASAIKVSAVKDRLTAEFRMSAEEVTKALDDAAEHHSNHEHDGH